MRTARMLLGAVVTAGAVVALAGCSTASAGSPSNTAAWESVHIPAATAKYISVDVAVNDSFVPHADIKAGTHGLVVRVTNKYSDDINFNELVVLAPQKVVSHESAPSDDMQASKLPSVCKPLGAYGTIALNQAELAHDGTASGEGIVIKKGSAAFGCGMIQKSALSNGEALVTVDTSKTGGNPVSGKVNLSSELK
ncbi:hypothetical protein [Curtobacterium sp. MCBD17_040]|uniref:hypothetical protein n=1 Tax=Curtobacterium sp. MCBD17_040 TaxID=2175674 RepID=UPI0011B5CBD6|nr:hypothetical protein [Curtobacterium sp. MCBD17_040]WIB65534.1 hypothetical protein DEI94_19360 [Curtobacterium sp. MCBD17_040]